MVTQARILTDADRRAAARLTAIYQRKKAELGLTQVKVGEALGIKQTTVSQYMRGVTRLGLVSILKFAEVLRVPPEEIDPEIRTRFATIDSVRSTVIPIKGQFSGAYQPHATVEIKGSYYMAHQLAVVVDDNTLYPILKPGSYIIIDPAAPPEPEDRILVRLQDGRGYRLFRLKNLTSRSVHVTRFEPVDDLDLISEEHFPPGSAASP